MNDNRNIVERKLSGVFTTIEVEVPYAPYEDFLDEMMNHLADLNIKIKRVAVAQLPEVMEAYHTAMLRAVADIYWGDSAGDIDCYRVANTIFADEIRAINEKREEKIRKQAEKLELRMKLVEIKQNEEAAKLALTQTTIAVTNENYKKALAILEAAGLVSKD